MEGSDTGLTKVRILDQIYHVRSADDPAYVRELAEYVDRKLQQISDSTPSVDTLKVAILAALNIADELFRLRKAEQEDQRWFGDELRECSLMLEELNR
ncbi:MAG TPA: cell division protein ZapA [Acidobacteriota bacterium]|jgi:cell division protein ZapA